MKYTIFESDEFYKILEISTRGIIPKPHFIHKEFETEYATIYHTSERNHIWFDTIIFKSEELHDLFLLKYF